MNLTRVATYSFNEAGAIEHALTHIHGPLASALTMTCQIQIVHVTILKEAIPSLR